MDLSDPIVRQLVEQHDLLEQAGRAGSLEHAFTRSQPGMCVHEIDLEKRIRQVNAEELRILGYAAQDMVGQPVWRFIVMQDAARRSMDQKLTGQRELKPFVRSFLRSDGTAVAMLLLDRYLVDATGGISGIRTVMVEIPISNEVRP